MSATTSPALPHAVGPVSFQATAAPPDATEFNNATSPGSSPVGGIISLALTPAKGTWPSGTVLTPQATGVQGKFTPDTRRPTGTEPAYFQFAPSEPGSGTFTAVASFAAVSSAPSPTPTPSPSPTPTPATPTPAPAPTSDGTLTGLPSTIVAGQPLSAVTYTPPQFAIYFVVYKVAGAVEEGLRWASSVMPGALTLLIPQTAGAYIVRAYDAATAGNKVYESVQITVSAAPGALPATPTQAADTGTTSSGTTMNWSATATSYRVLARPGVGTVYGSLADTTVSTNSFTFTGLASPSSPRAVVIPQNANGYGTPSGQFLSFTTA